MDVLRTDGLSSVIAFAEARGERSLASDLLKGIRPIADYIGETERRTYYLCERGYIPCGKEGATWVASKHALWEHYQRLTGVRTEPSQQAAP